MPIVHFTWKPTEIPANAQNVRAELETSRKMRSFYNEQGRYVETDEERYGPFAMWLYNTHTGLCISEREHNMRDDSDFFMTVWNDEKGAPESIMFASTRGWTYPSMASRSDATPEVLAKYNAWLEARAQERAVERAKAQAALAAAELKAPKKGRTVVVVKKSKNVAPGLKGVVFWCGEDKYATSKYGTWKREKPMRVGFKTADGQTFFCSASLLEVVTEG